MEVLIRSCDRSNRLLRVACVLLVTSVVSADPKQPGSSPAPTTPTTTQPVTPTPAPKPMHPVTPAGKRVEYAKDVLIDWSALQVEVTARVAQTDLPIELLLCGEGTKEHESILVTSAQPKKIYEALGLIGATAGTPVSFDPATKKQTAASGQPLDIEIAYEVDGKKTSKKAHEWMVDSKNKKPIGPLNWVFCGSRKDGEKFAADADGTIACVVDFSTSLIGLAESHSASDSELWVLADKNRVPKVGTMCTVVIRPVKKTATPPPATTVVTSTAPATQTEVIELQLTPEGFFQHGDDILDALSLDGLIKERIKTNPDQKVSLTAMPVEPAGVEKMNLFTRLAGRAIIGSGINQKNLTMKLLDEPEKKAEASPPPPKLDSIRRAAAEKGKPASSPAPSPAPKSEPTKP
ncbi:MAG: hypothetical protein DHS20C16_13090 [Phycisphaerae bacterium]|nr:MAG: hypothetical protein DHS20C16_13090 [Phycisphaerae bacterium]